MKNFMKIFGVALLAASCRQAPQQSLLEGRLGGMAPDDSLLVVCNGVTDTVAAPDGVFTYAYTDSVPGVVRFFNYPKFTAEGRMKAIRMLPLQVMMFPGESVQVTGDMDHPVIAGNDFYTAYNAMHGQVAVADSVKRSLNDAYMELLQAKAPQEEVRAVFARLKSADSVYQQQLEQYVSTHLDSEVSLFLMYYYHPKYGEKYIGQLSEALKQGRMKTLYEQTETYYERQLARRKAAELIREGKPAPGFVLKDIEGNDFDLATLRGKYVVLDFWGSWCGWCIKGMPDMKKMYAKYSDRLEIVGIDCRDTDEKWKAAVARHELPWIHVANGTDQKSDLTIVYNVGGFPTKVIITPEGNIAKVAVGESPEFYEAIDALLKK